MNIREAQLSGGSHVVILGAGASIAFSHHDGEASGLRLPSMSDLKYIDGVQEILDSFPQEYQKDNFEEMYSNLCETFPNDHRLTLLNENIYSYFYRMRLPMVPTLYDQLIMSLTNKDVIATFNWDPFLYQAWWRNYLHGSSPAVLFLHGNVAVGYNEEIDKMGPAGRTSRDGLYCYSPTQLLFPVKNKEYSKDKFISRQWEILRSYLHSDATHRVTVFGYSAPVSDKDALAMMKSAWGDINKRNLEQFEIIDVRPEDEVINSWNQFIHTHHYDYCTSFYESSLAQYPRRTSEAFFCHYLPLTPEEAFVDPFPLPDRFASFEEMWGWFQPLIDKEERSRN